MDGRGMGDEGMERGMSMKIHKRVEEVGFMEENNGREVKRQEKETCNHSYTYLATLPI